MLLTERASSRTVDRHGLDRAARTLLRLVADERGWKADQAARRLRTELGDDRLLRLLRARVLEAMAERPIPVDQRALTTLDHALLTGAARD